MVRTLKQSFPLGLVVIMLTSLIYIVVQQDVRTAANDPQIQIAEDLAIRFEGGESPEFLNTMPKIDIARSLATYASAYDSSGKLSASNAVLDGKTPTVPSGVLEYAKTHGTHTVTWQPRTGVRSAVVVVRYEGGSSGYAVVGRSLREVEKREEQLTLQIGLGLFAMLGILLAAHKLLRV